MRRYTGQPLVIGTWCGELRGVIAEAAHVHGDKGFFYLTVKEKTDEEDFVIVRLDGVAWIRKEPPQPSEEERKKLLEQVKQHGRELKKQGPKF